MTIAELRTKTIADLGFTTWYGSPKLFVDLTGPQQSAVTDRMSEYIVENAESFPAETVARAQKWVSSGIVGQPYANNSIEANVSDFLDEVGNQTVSLNEALNPFSEKNRGMVLGVVIGGLALYYIGPVLIEAFLTAKAGAKSASAAPVAAK